MPPNATPPTTYHNHLSDALLSTVDLLRRRQASDIADGYIEAYVALDWLEWHGGSLRLTTVGENQCKRLTAELHIQQYGNVSQTGKVRRTAA